MTGLYFWAFDIDVNTADTLLHRLEMHAGVPANTLGMVAYVNSDNFVDLQAMQRPWIAYVRNDTTASMTAGSRGAIILDEPNITGPSGQKKEPEVYADRFNRIAMHLPESVTPIRAGLSFVGGNYLLHTRKYDFAYDDRLTGVLADEYGWEPYQYLSSTNPGATRKKYIEQAAERCVLLSPHPFNLSWQGILGWVAERFTRINAKFWIDMSKTKAVGIWSLRQHPRANGAIQTKHSLYTQAKYHMAGRVLDISYRYMTDDWEIDSHTVDLRYRWPLGGSSYIEPHLRLYSQTAAEFYSLSLVDGETLPEYVSADYRLGEFDAMTAGVKYGWQTGGGNDMSIRLEFYRQSGDVASDVLIGNQVNQDNYPDLNAIIVQVGYQFGR